MFVCSKVGIWERRDESHGFVDPPAHEATNCIFRV